MEPGSAEAVHRKKASSLEKLWMSKGEFALLFSFFLVYIMRVLYTKIKAGRGAVREHNLGHHPGKHFRSQRNRKGKPPCSLTGSLDMSRGTGRIFWRMFRKLTSSSSPIVPTRLSDPGPSHPKTWRTFTCRFRRWPSRTGPPARSSSTQWPSRWAWARHRDGLL